MKFSAADQTAMIATLGEAVTIGTTSTTGDFRTSARDVNLFTGQVESTGPYCRVTESQVADLGITHGTSVTAGGVAYTVIGINEETGGFVTLNLAETT